MAREAGTNLKGAADGGDDGGGEVGARDDGHLPVPLLHRLRHLARGPSALPSRTLAGDEIEERAIGVGAVRSGDERRRGWRWIRRLVREEVGEGDGCFSLTCGPSRRVGRSDDSPPMVGSIPRWPPAGFSVRQARYRNVLNQENRFHQKPNRTLEKPVENRFSTLFKNIFNDLFKTNFKFICFN
jgi:hypothetical protein